MRSVAGLSRKALWRFLLAVSFGTALASFIYEIAWIRMLSLVMGTATHSFEIMLSAFILGLALGALWMRRRADTIENPLQVLGWIQWLMGAAALATLPLYVASFGWTVDLLSALNRNLGGYSLFNTFRYGIALLIMLPATFCAGMTLPLITRTLFSAGEGERAIGWVYGVNTLGSILGVIVASLLLMPVLGLKALLVVGGGLDMLLGVALLRAAVGGAPEGVRFGGGIRASGAAFGAVALALGILLGVPWDRALLSSGVYRFGRLPAPGTDIRYYRDGRTATVSAYEVPPGLLVLATNGKPDATISGGWLEPRSLFRTNEAAPESASLEVKPLSTDEPTQVLTALITAAYNPSAEGALVIGQGSGLSSHMLLASPVLESLVTVEIEPRMIEGSRIFLPATQRVFEDPRSRFIIDDAKSYLAAEGESLDLILSEPSNPWVSGVSSLFTQEFYARVRERLAPGGVFGQWIHLYEMEDGLVLSVLAALHEVFPSYAVFLVNSTDMLIVAGVDEELMEPDWTVFQWPGAEEDLSLTFPFHAEFLESSLFLNREALVPLLDDWPQPNSDFFPVLDLGAERARFLRSSASGILASASGHFDFSDIFLPPRSDGGEALRAPVPQIPMFRALALRNRTLATLSSDGDGPSLDDASDGSNDQELRQALFRYQRSRALLDLEQAPADWLAWLGEILEGGGWTATLGWRALEEGFLEEATASAEDLGAPHGLLAALSFVGELEDGRWGELVSTSEILLEEVEDGRRWITPEVLMDAGVAARLLAGNPETAEEFFQRVSAFSTRPPWDFRTRLLRAHLDRASSPR
jgi:predicted membrane-bound spermidine synthase